MRRASSESAGAPVSHNAAGPVELNDVCRTKLKLPYQTDSDAVLLPNLIHQLGSAHEWSGVWIRPELKLNLSRSLICVTHERLRPNPDAAPLMCRT